jgi:hypothetical protein
MPRRDAMISKRIDAPGPTGLEWTGAWFSLPRTHAMIAACNKNPEVTMRIFAFFAVALFLGGSQASAWEEYNYLDQGVAIQFPTMPEMTKSTYDSILAKGLPATVYSAEDDHVVYKLTSSI